MDRQPTPPADIVLAFGPALLTFATGFLAWALPMAWQPAAIALGWLWSAAILLFLAGVTRGLSFFTPGGARVPQLAQMIWLFLLGLFAFATPLAWALPLLMIGYACVAAFDLYAAPRAMAPPHFARIRPLQVMLFLAGLAALWVRVRVLG
jgi:hypothetical protein